MNDATDPLVDFNDQEVIEGVVRRLHQLFGDDEILKQSIDVLAVRTLILKQSNWAATVAALDQAHAEVNEQMDNPPPHGEEIFEPVIYKRYYEQLSFHTMCALVRAAAEQRNYREDRFGV